jgi:hypothetical protein
MVKAGAAAQVQSCKGGVGEPKEGEGELLRCRGKGGAGWKGRGKGGVQVQPPGPWCSLCV